MIIAAIDVGVTTGFVLAKGALGEMPIIYVSRNILYSDPEAMESMDKYAAMTYVVELPLISPKSNNFAEMQKVMDIWGKKIAQFEERGAKIINVRPSEWKTSAAKKINVFAEQDEKWPNRSKHEKDASKMVYWFLNRKDHK